MPIRIRKSFKIFPGVRVNLSKGGASFTVGAKGYHLNFSKRGVRQTVGLPGSGISETSYIIKNQPDSESKKSASSAQKDSEAQETEAHGAPAEEPHARRKAPAWLLLLGIVVAYVGAVLLGVIPSNFLSQLLHTLTEWTRGLGL